MREPYWHDETATLYAGYTGGAREVLTEMPDASADCIITSPPPWTPHSTRNPAPSAESAGHEAIPGHEPTPALYIAALRRIFAEAHRVLADEGTAWLATADLYTHHNQQAGPSAGRHSRSLTGNLDQAMTGRPAASLIGLPWQLAFALRDDGWIIRNAIVCAYPTTDTPPGTDQFTPSYELIFLLAKQTPHYFDPDGTRRPLDRLITEPRLDGSTRDSDGGRGYGRRHARRQTDRRGNSGNAAGAAVNCRGWSGTATPSERHDAAPHVGGSAGDAWALPARPRHGMLPIGVPLRCIATGCRPGGTVVDMFAGIATTGLAARALARSYIGIAETPELCRIAERRLRQHTGPTNSDF